MDESRFAYSLEEAISRCKAQAQLELKEDLETLAEYGFASLHTDKEAIREVTSIPCDTNYVLEKYISSKRGLGLGEICAVSANATMRVQRLVPDKESVGDPNWNKPYNEDAVPLTVVIQYPCANGNGCETILRKNPVEWVVREPEKCTAKTNR